MKKTKKAENKAGRGRSTARRLALSTLPAGKKKKTTSKGGRMASGKPGARKKKTHVAMRTARGGKRPLRLVWAEAGSLADNPRNWRRHPEGQMSALRAVLDQGDWAGALLYNETTGRLIDGHARKDAVDPKTVVPVLVGRWPEERERQILATLDPLGAMAVADADALERLLVDTDLSDEGMEELRAMLDELINAAADGEAEEEDETPSRERAHGVSNLFSVIVECKDESDQLKFYNRMKKEGRKCKLYVL